MHTARKDSRYLQEYQIDYIMDNHHELSTIQMSGAIGCSQTTVIYHCKKLKIKPTKSYFQMQPPVIPPCVKPEVIK
jgi:hypothetical protein